MKTFEVLPEEIRKKFEIEVDYVLVHCTNPNCDAHWGVSLRDRKSQELNVRDFICNKCSGDKRAREI